MKPLINRPRIHRFVPALLAALLAAGAPVPATTTSAAQRIAPLDLELQTPSGVGAFVVASVRGEERLGRPFRYDIRALSPRASIAPAELLGRKVTLTMDLPTGRQRAINGYVDGFRGGADDRNGWHDYELAIRSSLSMLSHETDFRAFQNVDVTDIVQGVFDDHGFGGDVRFDVDAPRPRREYVVQYGETDMNFVNRLLEDEGLFYVFEHHDGRHEMLVFDGPRAFRRSPGYERLHVWPDGVVPPGSVIPPVTDVEVEYQITPGSTTLDDYDFRAPSVDLSARASRPNGHSLDAFEANVYPGLHRTPEEGMRLAERRLDEAQVRFETIRIETMARGLHPGHSFTLTDHRSPLPERELHVIATSTELVVGSPLPGDPPREDEASITVVAIDADVPYRPQRVTPSPRAHGPETAVVVGPDGEEIYTDDYGRVKVKFHWDRESSSADKSSLWIRVAQPWGGKGATGSRPAVFIPRIGQEVIVDFLEGNPDRPIVTGRVYHSENMPPERWWNASSP